MKPRLVAMSGPLAGAVFPITDTEIVIGRDANNRICLNDSLVSRRHCTLREVGGEVQLSDLQSMNGTFVNGASIHEKKLQHGDQIKIGCSSFAFSEYEDSKFSVPSFRDEPEDQSRTRVFTVIRREDALFLQTDKFGKQLPTTSRIASDLSALLKISASISTIRNGEKLQHRLLELIFEVLPAERAAVLMVGQRPEEFVSAAYAERGTDSEEPFRVSRTITHRVLHEGIAVMSNDMFADGAFSPAESIHSSNVLSVLCVPITVYETKLGVIYLDTTHSKGSFDSEHLQLLAAIAGIAAVALEHVRYVEWLEGENQRLQEEIRVEHDMIGDSPQIREVYQFIGKVAPVESTVLIRGENGTGKELVARAIHRNSRRANGPFVAINCAAIPEHLLESELFGYERGAFTSAVGSKKGRIENAEGGTLFLDEVGDLARNVQAKLLRVLQEREFERLGGTKPIKVNIRVVAATNVDLEEAIKKDSFRKDLLYRLNVISIAVPPLRARKDDIAGLAGYFVQKYNRDATRPVIGITPQAEAILKNYDWPGNVRELQNAIERAVVLGDNERIRPEDLPEALLEGKRSPGHPTTLFHETVNDFKRETILKAIQQSQGSITGAAKLLDLHPNYLHRLIRKLGLREQLASGGSKKDYL